MEHAARFTTLARRSQEIEDFGRDFGRFTFTTTFVDEMLKSLFKIGANCHRPIDLPDTTRLNLREAIVRCLESIQL